jgi:hypothetical protein
MMRNSVKKGMASLSVVGLCILAFLAISLPQAMANGLLPMRHTATVCRWDICTEVPQHEQRPGNLRVPGQNLVRCSGLLCRTVWPKTISHPHTEFGEHVESFSLCALPECWWTTGERAYSLW